MKQICTLLKRAKIRWGYSAILVLFLFALINSCCKEQRIAVKVCSNVFDYKFKENKLSTATDEAETSGSIIVITCIGPNGHSVPCYDMDDPAPPMKSMKKTKPISDSVEMDIEKEEIEEESDEVELETAPDIKKIDQSKIKVCEGAAWLAVDKKLLEKCDFIYATKSFDLKDEASFPAIVDIDAKTLKKSTVESVTEDVKLSEEKTFIVKVKFDVSKFEDYGKLYLKFPISDGKKLYSTYAGLILVQ